MSFKGPNEIVCRLFKKYITWKEFDLIFIQWRGFKTAANLNIILHLICTLLTFHLYSHSLGWCLVLDSLWGRGLWKWLTNYIKV